MASSEELKVGDKIEIYVGSPPCHKTMVDDITADNIIFAGVPTYKGIIVPLRREQELKIYYFRPTGRYCLDVRIKKFYIIGSMRTMSMETLAPPRREQRRLAFRVSANIRTVVCIAPEDPHALALEESFSDDATKEIAYTRDISEMGVGLSMKRECRVGDRLRLELYLPLLDRGELPLTAFAEVRQIHENETGKGFIAGMQFLKLGEFAHAQLLKYIMLQQRLLMRRRSHEADR